MTQENFDFSSWEATLPGFLRILGTRTSQEYLQEVKLDPSNVATPEELIQQLRQLVQTNQVYDAVGLRAMRTIADHAILLTQQMTPEVADDLQGYVDAADYAGLYAEIARIMPYTFEPVTTALNYTATLIAANHRVLDRASPSVPTGLQVAYWTYLYWGHSVCCGPQASTAALSGVLHQLSQIHVA